MKKVCFAKVCNFFLDLDMLSMLGLGVIPCPEPRRRLKGCASAISVEMGSCWLIKWRCHKTLFLRRLKDWEWSFVWSLLLDLLSVAHNPNRLRLARRTFQIKLLIWFVIDAMIELMPNSSQDHLHIEFSWFGRRDQISLFFLLSSPWRIGHWPPNPPVMFVGL